MTSGVYLIQLQACDTTLGYVVLSTLVQHILIVFISASANHSEGHIKSYCITRERSLSKQF